MAYTPSGKIAINLTFDIINNSNVHFKLNITDTGIGIEKEKQALVFEKFTRIRDNKDLTNSGLGLGLSISKHLISLMNGSIELKSELGKGSCFTIELTLPIVNNSAASTTNRLQFMTPIFDAKVLVVEDYLYNLLVIKELLEKFGCTVETCSDGITALQMLKDNEYNIVFLDIDLPGMNGIEVTKAFRAFEKAEDPTASRHIVAITAYSLNANKTTCIAAGMDAFMAKPFEEAELVETLELFTDTPPSFTPVQKTITFIDPNKEPEAQTDHTKLNIDPIISISNKDPQKTISQIECIIDELKEKLQEIETAINDDDHQQIHRISHQSLSLIRMFNYTPLSSIMSIISNTSKRGEMETSRALLYDLKKETFKAISLLHKEIASFSKNQLKTNA
jgi:CheY-like chemotaxis protein